MPQTIGSITLGVGARATGKGALGKVLGVFGGPWGLAATFALAGLEIAWNKIFKPKIEPLPVRTHNLTGGREEARWIVGQVRVPLEWTDGTALPGSQYRDNHVRLISCISLGECESIERVWINQDPFPVRVDPSEAGAYIPPAGSQYVLPPGDVSKYGFPSPYAFTLRPKLLADGTQAQTARTVTSSGDPRSPLWQVPADREYNGNPGETDWGAEPTNATTRYRDPFFVCAGGEELGGDNLCYDPSLGNVPQNEGDANWMTGNAPTTNYRETDYALEVRAIDANYRLEDIAWAQIDLFQPFFQQSDTGRRLYKGLPDIDLLVKGIKITWPGQATPTWTDNPAAILHWFDTEVRGIDPTLIDEAAFREAYAICDADVTLRYGAGVPADSLGAEGDLYASQAGRAYRKVSSKWVDEGRYQGDYDWLTAVGRNGVYTYKRYSCNLEIVSGESVEDTTRRILATMAGIRHEGDRIVYRAGAFRPSSLTVTAADVLEVEDCEPWGSADTRANEYIARMPQSEANDWLPDSAAFEDPFARARDGRRETLEFTLDGASNPLRARAIARTFNLLARATGSWAVRIGHFPDMAQAREAAGNTWTMTLPEYGWDATEVQVAGVRVLPDMTVVAVLREKIEGAYDPILALPALQPRALQFYQGSPAPEPSGLAVDEFARAIAGGGVLIRHVVTWDEAAVARTEARARIQAAQGQDAHPWQAMSVEGARAELLDVAAGDTYETQVRHWSIDGNPSTWQSAPDNTIDGDLTPPAVATGVAGLSGFLQVGVSYTPPTDADFAHVNVYMDAAAGATTKVGESRDGFWHSGTDIPANATRYIRLISVDTSGNESAYSTEVTARSVAQAAAGAVLRSGSGVPGASLGNDGDIYIRDNGEVYFKTGGAWVLQFDATAGEGSFVYFVDIPNTQALPVAGTTMLLRGGTIPAAVSIPAGSVAVDASDGRLWDWNPTTMAFVLRGRLTGGDLKVTDLVPVVCNPGAIRVDKDGVWWECNAEGTGEFVTGIVAPPTGEEPSTDPTGREIWRSGQWPPHSSVGEAGDGAYTGSGVFGTRGADGWTAGAGGSFGGPEGTTYSIYRIDTAADLPDWDPQTQTFNVGVTMIRIAVDTGFIYRWDRGNGNWIKAGEIFGATVATITQAPPGNFRWSVGPTRQSDGTYDGTLAWDAVAGGDDYVVRLVPQIPGIPNYTTKTTTQAIEGMLADHTYTAYLRTFNVNQVPSSEVVVVTQTGASGVNLPSAVRMLAFTVSATLGDLTFTWALPTTNGNLVTQFVVEVRQGTSLYQMQTILGRATLRAFFARVPAGTYSATVVAWTAGGPGPASTLNNVVVPVRVSSEFPPPESPAMHNVGGRFPSMSWARPSGISASRPVTYKVWCAQLDIDASVIHGLTTRGDVGNRGPAFTFTPPHYPVASPSNVVAQGRYVACYSSGGVVNYSNVTTFSMASRSPPRAAPANFPPAPVTTVTLSNLVEGTMVVTIGTLAITALNAGTAPTFMATESIVTVGTRRLYVQHAINTQYPNEDFQAGRGGTTQTFTNLPAGVQLRVETRFLLGGVSIGQSAAAVHTFTLPRITSTDVPEPTGMSVTTTSAAATVSGPATLPTDVNAIQYYWYETGEVEPSSPTLTTVSAFPFTITGLTNDTAYTIRVRYRAGAAGSYLYSDYVGIQAPLGNTAIAVPAQPASITITVSAEVQGQVTMTCPRVTGAVQYRFTYLKEDGSGLAYGQVIAQPDTGDPSVTFRNVPIGAWVGLVAAENTGGSGDGREATFMVTMLAGPVTPAPPPVLTAPTAVVITASLTGTQYTLTASWTSVTGAVRYRYQWKRRAAGGTTDINVTGVGARGSTTGFIAQLSTSDGHLLTEGETFVLEVRAEAAAGNLGPVRSARITARRPTIALPSSGQIVRVTTVSVRLTSVILVISKSGNNLTYSYRTRTMTGTTDLTAQSGTVTLGDSDRTARIAITGLTAATAYRFWVRVGTTGPETAVTATTNPTSAGARGRDIPGGSADAPEVLQIWMVPPLADGLRPPEEDGVEGQECVLLNDGSRWIKRGGKWVALVLPHDSPDDAR